MKITVEYWPPPIPIRDFDWHAIAEDYDADCNENGYFSRCGSGYGKSRRSAIIDLLDSLEIE